ncbi:hypothetical protein MCOR25_007280 [Pyricularia grisea]|uniref:C2H2-type domain-containing protein n=1 Tax=Pyricularia grisea TaxID=148305 RepID=A0A6P8BHS1_PYRGI|nr:uncharacterized protein PgNI_00790 [Pyricularia grisea]KAI6358711.1 hypothetical protein MCOR25_007280 [Pyricularia grisea]TLD16275.1 hypothetical protein PgNI_00790 [Pyricularia grisea]
MAPVSAWAKEALAAVNGQPIEVAAPTQAEPEEDQSPSDDEWDGQPWQCDLPPEFTAAFYPSHQAVREVIDAWAAERNIDLTSVRTCREKGELFKEVLGCRHRLQRRNVPETGHRHTTTARTALCTWQVVVQTKKSNNGLWTIRTYNNLHTGHAPYQQFKVRRRATRSRDLFTTKEHAAEFTRLAVDPTVSSKTIFEHMTNKFPNAGFEIADIYRYRADLRRARRHGDPAAEATFRTAESGSFPELDPAPAAPAADTVATSFGSVTKPKRKSPAERKLTTPELQAMERMFLSPHISVIDIAKAFKIGSKSVMKHKKRFESVGKVTRKTPEPKFKQFHLEKLLELLDKDDSLGLSDLQKFLADNYNVKVSRAWISTKLTRANRARRFKQTQQPVEEPAEPEEVQIEADANADPLPEQEEVGTEMQLESMVDPAPEERQEDASGELESRLLPMDIDRHAEMDGQPLFSCPYYRNDQWRFINSTTCRSGFPNIPDLKSHLSQCHTNPRYICFRCDEVFKDSPSLEQHQRQETACPLRERQYRVGMSWEQEDKVRKQQAVPRQGQTHAWLKIYDILFPGSGLAASTPLIDVAVNAPTTGVDPFLWESERSIPSELQGT